MKIFQSPTGDSFEQAFRNARAVATEHLEPVHLRYSDFWVMVWPDSTLEQTRTLWREVARLHFGSMAVA